MGAVAGVAAVHEAISADAESYAESFVNSLEASVEDPLEGSGQQPDHDMPLNKALASTEPGHAGDGLDALSGAADRACGQAVVKANHIITSGEPDFDLAENASESVAESISPGNSPPHGFVPKVTVDTAEEISPRNTRPRVQDSAVVATKSNSRATHPRMDEARTLTKLPLRVSHKVARLHAGGTTSLMTSLLRASQRAVRLHVDRSAISTMLPPRACL